MFCALSFPWLRPSFFWPAPPLASAIVLKRLVALPGTEHEVDPPRLSSMDSRSSSRSRSFSAARSIRSLWLSCSSRLSRCCSWPVGAGGGEGGGQDAAEPQCFVELSAVPALAEPDEEEGLCWPDEALGGLLAGSTLLYSSSSVKQPAQQSPQLLTNQLKQNRSIRRVEQKIMPRLDRFILLTLEASQIVLKWENR